jgi:hypothetical protein
VPFLLLAAMLFLVVFAADFFGTTLRTAAFFAATGFFAFFVATFFAAVFFGADFLVAGFFVAALDFAAFFAVAIPTPLPSQSITSSNTC